MTARCRVLAFLLTSLSLPVVARGAEQTFLDDFSQRQDCYERIGPGTWKIQQASCQFTSPHESLWVTNLEQTDNARIEARLSIRRRLSSGGYCTAGLALWADAQNHWRLLLVAGPGDKTYFELCERYQDIHQATGMAGTRLAGKQEGDLHGWHYDRSYQLSLVIGSETISGEVRDPQSGQFWRQSFRLASGKAVRAGRPGIECQGTEGAFQSLSVHFTPTGNALLTASGPAGSVAVVEDQARQVAPLLANELKSAGFGVTIVPWGGTAEKRFSAAATDLVVVADARRVPAAVSQACETYLHSRGKLLTVGAPAFGTILLATKRGYVAAEVYGAAIFDQLHKDLLPLSSSAWHRGTSDKTRPAAVQPNGPAEWKISLDYVGWDYFAQAIKGFPAGHDLLCFRAKGDAQTPQVFLECLLADGSRWTTTLDLAQQWRGYVLRSGDFSYWPDSKTHRGKHAEKLLAAEIREIRFGVAKQQTPHSYPGKHVFWVEQLSTAADPNPAAALDKTPAVDCLSPSYTIYPLQSTTSLRPAQQLIEPLFAGEKGDRSNLPVGPQGASHKLDLSPSSSKAALDFAAAGYSPLWREGGEGFDRDRHFRWIRLIDAYDAAGTRRGSLLWVAVGENYLPGALWSNLGVADPAILAQSSPAARLLLDSLVRTAQAMADGCFLLEGGAHQFSCQSDEPIELGARVANYGRREKKLEIHLSLADIDGRSMFARRLQLVVPPGRQCAAAATFAPGEDPQYDFPYTAAATLYASGQAAPRESIGHQIHQLQPADDEDDGDYIGVQGSHFDRDGEPWYMHGINYRANNQGGRELATRFDRATYDPQIIERELAWMESAGIKLLSGIQSPRPDDPDAAEAYANVRDFLARCQRHNMKVFYFLQDANPLAGGNAKAIRQQIEAAGIKDHPAIFAWELSWEPIYRSWEPLHAGTKAPHTELLIPAWNAWIAERYGSLASAEREWNYRIPRVASSQTAALLPMPCSAARGPWDRAAAAFRRFFGDYAGRAYGDVIRALRRYDPKHLISFRFGACGLPAGAKFAHAHSAGVAKYIDFLCPEGYCLQPRGPDHPTTGDEVRQGGLTTLYFRFLSREKPVVWMEFGYSVNGMHKRWTTGCEHIPAAELANQRSEFEKFYRMFVESGARGASPWWLPGGFRLGEDSDFGVLEPDGSPRPACAVMHQFAPRFAAVVDYNCVADASDNGPDVIRLDPDAHDEDSWNRYVAQYLSLVNAGRRPRLGTAGTGTTSANTPLLAVGGAPCNGQNPPQYLNAQFNSVEVQESTGLWQETADGDVLAAHRAEKLHCRVSVGNTAEATWLAPFDVAPALLARFTKLPEKPGSRPAHGNKLRLSVSTWFCGRFGPFSRVFRVASNAGATSKLAPAADASGVQPGRVYLSCRWASGQMIDIPIPANTPYLADAEVADFLLPHLEGARASLTLQMVVVRQDRGTPLRIPFGEKRQLMFRGIE